MWCLGEGGVVRNMDERSERKGGSVRRWSDRRRVGRNVEVARNEVRGRFGVLYET